MDYRVHLADAGVRLVLRPPSIIDGSWKPPAVKKVQ
jgi:hypothetical protein